MTCTHRRSCPDCVGERPVSAALQRVEKKQRKKRRRAVRSECNFPPGSGRLSPSSRCTGCYLEEAESEYSSSPSPPAIRCFPPLADVAENKRLPLSAPSNSARAGLSIGFPPHPAPPHSSFRVHRTTRPPALTLYSIHQHPRARQSLLPTRLPSSHHHSSPAALRPCPPLVCASASPSITASRMRGSPRPLPASYHVSTAPLNL